MKNLLIVFSLLLMGCGSTPYRDDYTKHVNFLNDAYFNGENYKFSFEGGDFVDFRGLYSKNNTATSTPILYQGGGGVAGLLLQIAGHSSIVSSERDSILHKEQKKANQKIQPLILASENIALTDLIGGFYQDLTDSTDENIQTVKIKPIFFSNPEMTEFSLKSVVWVPNSKKKRGLKRPFKYKNLVQVYGEKLTKEQQDKILAGNNEYLIKLLSSLMEKTLSITKSELTGAYVNVQTPVHTYFIEENKKKNVIRGSVVSEQCDYRVIKSLHSWLIAYPRHTNHNGQTNELIAKCS